MTVIDRAVKRAVDLSLALPAIVVLGPIVFLIAALARLDTGASGLFKQSRPGLNRKLFQLYKFRTMSDIYDSEGRLMSDEDRLTTFGHILRRFSVDEIQNSTMS